MPDRLPVDLPTKVNMAKQMAREEVGDNSKELGITITNDGIRLPYSNGTVIDYTWHEVELEIIALEMVNAK